MIRFQRVLVFVCGAMCAATCSGQDPEAADTARELQKKRLKLMSQRVQALKVEAPDDDEAAFAQEPVLRYNDTPRGVRDASVWMLGQQGRPRAVLVVEVYDHVNCEITAAADPPKSVQAPSFRWTPRQGGFQWTRIPVTTPPGERSSVRLRQIKQLVRDFAASEFWAGQTYHLRLMPQPLHEYADEEQGVLDGAVFVWAHGTNVEILMYVEARREEENSPPYWVAGFSRLAAASLIVQYRDQEFWSAPSGAQVAGSSTYYYRMLPLTGEERAAFMTE